MIVQAKQYILFYFVRFLFFVTCVTTFNCLFGQFTPGTVYLSSNGYIEYTAGNLPIVITAPHGGALKPTSIPDRNCANCVVAADANTQELAKELRDSIYRLYGGYPHVIINLLHRVKLDANREIVEAAQGNAIAEESWYAFHSFIDTAKQQIAASGQRGFYVDLHGHGHAIQRLELGYLLSATQLRLSDSQLDTSLYVNNSSIRYLANHNIQNVAFSTMLRGSNSFGTLITNRGYPSVPSSQDAYPQPDDEYFDGGYNTQRHSSYDGTTILDGLQIECHSGVRSVAATRQGFAKALAQTIMDYMNTHFVPTITSSSSGGNWNSTSTWMGGVIPGMGSNVVIAADATVNVNVSNAACANLSFGNNNAKLAFTTATSELSVYGDFAINSTTHSAIANWTQGAKLTFKGNAATQRLSNWSTGSNSTVIMEMRVDKAKGKVATSAAGMRLGIGNSLDITRGTFELSAADDIEFKDLNYNGTTGTITVQPAGTFNMLGGNSHIRRGIFIGDESSKIGKLTVSGIANLGSSNATQRLNFGGIDIENGGVLDMASGKSTAAGVLNCGTITVKNGGTFKNSVSNTNYWYQAATNTTALTINSGGTYSSNTAFTVLPTVTNFSTGSTSLFNGSGTQTLPLATYHHLSLSNTGSSLSGNTIVNGNLNVASGDLNIGTNTLTCNAAINAGSGLINAAIGTIILAGASQQTIPVNVFSNPVNNLSINNSNGVNLNTSLTVSGTLNLQNGPLNVGANTLSFHSGNTPIIRTTGTINLSQTSSVAFGADNLQGGSAFTIPDNVFTTAPSFHSFTVNRSNALTLNNQNFTLRGKLQLKAGNLVLPNNYVFTLSAKAIDTFAVVDAVGNTASITYGSNARFCVEKFIPRTKRAYRVIAPGVNSGSITFFDSWQESGNNTNGYGTHITGKAGSLGIDTATGFDKTQRGAKSLFTYHVNTTTGLASWLTYNSTNANTDTLSAYKGYMLTVRGNRAYNLAADNLLMNSAVTLRNYGRLVTGTVDYTASGVTANGTTNNNIRMNFGSATGFSLLGNPYVAPLDWHSIASNTNTQNIEPVFWHFDPNVGTSGAYVTYNSFSGTSSNPGGSFVNRYIQPGQAFFVKNTSTNPRIQIRESDKAGAASGTAIFDAPITDTIHKVVISLLKNGANMDAAVLVCAPRFSDSVGREDALKMTNPGENIAIGKYNKLWSIEGRSIATSTDTLQLHLSQLNSADQYELNIDTRDWYLNDKQLVLADSAYNILMPLTPNSLNKWLMGSVTRKLNLLIQPVVLTNQLLEVKTVKTNTGYSLQWHCPQAQTKEVFNIEVANNGLHFKVMDSVRANGETLYTWHTPSPDVANHFARVVWLQNNGTRKVSNAVWLAGASNQKAAIAVYPTIVKANGYLQIHVREKGARQYQLQMVNMQGVIVQQQALEVKSGVDVLPFPIRCTTKGTYLLKITGGIAPFQQALIVE